MTPLEGEIALILGGLVLGSGLAALLVLGAVVCPRLVGRARQHAERTPIRSFLVGLINFAFFGLLASAAGARGGILGLIGLLLVAALFSGVALGLSAVAQLVGERLRPADPRPLPRLLAGALTLELAALTPLVGWVVVPLVAGLVGFGAVIIALLWRRAPAPAGALEAPLQGDPYESR